MSEKNQKTKPHDCEWKKWIDEVYRPWYEQQQATAEDDGDEDGDEGGNPGGPPPPPPPGP